MSAETIDASPAVDAEVPNDPRARESEFYDRACSAGLYAVFINFSIIKLLSFL
mgnify:CR=1 FL=1